VGVVEMTRQNTKNESLHSNSGQDNQANADSANHHDEDENAQASSESGEQQEAARDTWFTPILAGLHIYFEGRADQEDLHILSFSLWHIISCLDALYFAILLDPDKYRANLPFGEYLTHQRLTWARLQEIRRILERLEPLCQLLNGTATCLLNTLDTPTDIIPFSTRPADQDEEPALASSHFSQEEREQAILDLCARVSTWREHQLQQCPFSSRFTALTISSEISGRIDTAFDLLLESAQNIFGDILVDFQAVSTGDDEAVATLLLDLIQKADQVMLQIETLLEPLHSMIKQYALEGEMN
jgi:hypothetical protein